MARIFLALLFFILLTGIFSQQRPAIGNDLLAKEYVHAEGLYKKASEPGPHDHFSETEQEDLYKQALTSFGQLAPLLQQNHLDSLAVHAYLQAGFIEHYFDSTGPAANNYRQAIALASTVPSLPDSFLFRPCLFSGIILYGNNQYDSAMYYYKAAEKIQEKYSTALNESQRLYNLLGVMYYGTGNYRQAANYFEKAIELLHARPTANPDLLVNYTINIGSIFIKLEQYQAADSIFRSILPMGIHTNEILHNMGIVYQKMGLPQQAIGYFKKVKYGNSKKNIDLYYNLGTTYASMQQPDSAAIYIQKAIAENNNRNGRQKNVPAGLLYKYEGDALNAKGDHANAASRYQQAIIQFANAFYSGDIYTNPGQYTGVFSYINLFQALTAKASAMENLYAQQKDLHLLEGALDAYRAAFKLADYVERSYDSDEARLFLNKIKYDAHSQPIDLSFRLYALTNDRSYLEEVYLFDQRSKATILSLNVQENEWRNSRQAGNQLYQREASLRSSITRLSLNAAQLTDSEMVEKTTVAIREYEIELGKLQEKINADPVYNKNHFTERIPPVKELQSRLDAQTAVVSYHLSRTALVTILITAGTFDCLHAELPAGFYSAIDSFKYDLGTITEGARYQGGQLAAKMYATLISPVSPALSNIKRLIIIPDDELNYLPFEAFTNEQKKYLVEDFSIQYQYSTALLERPATTGKLPGILAVAPFAGNGVKDIATTLPASAKEVSALAGKVLLDKEASKEIFLRLADQYGVIHLATHASIDNIDPQRSFISFYPTATDNGKLYAQEIYNMRLDSTRLIILSACETGTGKLVKGEGLLSLSRAFAYAGCSNIITSLWKAEDNTTAFLTKRLHYYLDKGYTDDQALQQAKLDLLKNTGIDARFKTPNYWAQLIFIGQYERAGSFTSKNILVWLIIAVIAILFLFVWRMRRMKRL